MKEGCASTTCRLSSREKFDNSYHRFLNGRRAVSSYAAAAAAVFEGSFSEASEWWIRDWPPSSYTCYQRGANSDQAVLDRPSPFKLRRSTDLPPPPPHLARLGKPDTASSMLRHSYRGTSGGRSKRFHRRSHHEREPPHLHSNQRFISASPEKLVVSLLPNVFPAPGERNIVDSLSPLSSSGDSGSSLDLVSCHPATSSESRWSDGLSPLSTDSSQNFPGDSFSTPKSNSKRSTTLTVFPALRNPHPPPAATFAFSGTARDSWLHEHVAPGRPLTSPRQADVQGIPVFRHQFQSGSSAFRNNQISRKQAEELSSFGAESVDRGGLTDVWDSRLQEHRSSMTNRSMLPPPLRNFQLSEETFLEHLIGVSLPSRLLRVKRSSRLTFPETRTAFAGAVEPRQEGCVPIQNGNGFSELEAFGETFLLQILICWKCRLEMAVSVDETRSSTGNLSEGRMPASSDTQLKEESFRSKASKSTWASIFSGRRGNGGEVRSVRRVCDMDAESHVEGKSWPQILEEEFSESWTPQKAAKIYWVQPANFNVFENVPFAVSKGGKSFVENDMQKNSNYWGECADQPDPPSTEGSPKPAARWDLFERMCSCSSAEYSKYAGAVSVTSELVAEFLADQEERCFVCDSQFPLPLIICQDEKLISKYAASIKRSDQLTDHQQLFRVQEPTSFASGCALSESCSRREVKGRHASSSISNVSSTVDTIVSCHTAPHSPKSDAQNSRQAGLVLNQVAMGATRVASGATGPHQQQPQDPLLASFTGRPSPSVGYRENHSQHFYQFGPDSEAFPSLSFPGNCGSRAVDRMRHDSSLPPSEPGGNPKNSKRDHWRSSGRGGGRRKREGGSSWTRFPPLTDRGAGNLPVSLAGPREERRTNPMIRVSQQKVLQSDRASGVVATAFQENGGKRSMM